MNTFGQKIAAALCVATLGFGFILLDYARWRGLGKFDFLQYQSDQFDRFIATPGPQLVINFVGVLFATAVLIGGYELILFLLRRVSPSRISR